MGRPWGCGVHAEVCVQACRDGLRCVSVCRRGGGGGEMRGSQGVWGCVCTCVCDGTTGMQQDQPAEPPTPASHRDMFPGTRTQTHTGNPHGAPWSPRGPACP